VDLGRRRPGLRNDFARNRGYEQWWRHEPGCEYLVANPVEISSLTRMLEPSKDAVLYRIEFGWNNENRKRKPEADEALDPFACLSGGLKAMILACLGSKDIASLRLTSPSFM